MTVVNASLSIQGQARTVENYNATIKILKERFGDEQVKTSAHMDVFLNIQLAQSKKYLKLEQFST